MELDIVTRTLVLLETSLDMYGKTISADTARAWAMAFEYRGLTDRSLIERTAGWFLANGKRFPCPGEFIDKAQQLAAEEYIAIGVPCDDGETVRIELVPVGDHLAEPRRVPTVAGVVSPRPLPPVREIPTPMAEAETEAERRRQLDALRGEE